MLGFIYVQSNLRNYAFLKPSNKDFLHKLHFYFDFPFKARVKRWNVSGIISTEAEQKNGYFTGKIIGITCKGENKQKKIEAVLGKGVLKDAIAYADEEDDILLSSVSQGIMIS